MKKISIFISCFLLLIILTSCASTGGSEGSYNVYYGEPESKNFSLSGKTEITKPKDIEEQKTIDLNGKIYSLQYHKTYETAISGVKKIDKYSKYVTYKNESVYADIQLETGMLLMFCNLDEDVRTRSGNLTEDEARVIADSTLLSVYGTFTQEEYEYETTVYSDTDFVRYTIVYRKYVWGVPSKDAIQISVNMNGDVVAINAKYLGLFSFAESQISKEDIDGAISTLYETCSDRWSIGAETLIIDAEGDYYISARLYNNKNGNKFETPIEVYVNVN